MHYSIFPFTGLVLGMFLFTPARSQSFAYPKLAPQVRVVTDIIPTGWGILDYVAGDLNGDKSRDFVLVLEHKAYVKLPKNNTGTMDSVNTQPRMLVVLFRESANNIFRLVEQNNDFILLDDTPGMEDPYQSVKIENGLLLIDFVLFYADPVRPVTSTTYKFRYQDQTFALVAAETGFFNRITNDFREYSFDFVTHAWSLSQGNELSKEKPVIEQHTLEKQPPLTLREILHPYVWEVTQGIYL